MMDYIDNIKNPLKDCVINFAKGKNYPLLQQRLKENFEKFQFKGDLLLFKDESELDSPTHSEHPYAFKVKAFQKAINYGYENVLWCDSSINPVKNPSPIFEYIEKNGHMFFWDGWNCGQWTNDRMLKYFNITREEAFNIPQIYACFIGLNLKNKTSLKFLEEWEKAIPYFSGSWTNKNKTESNDETCLGHRHDQSAASIIAYNLGMFDETRYANKWLELNSVATREDVIVLVNGC